MTAASYPVQRRITSRKSRVLTFLEGKQPSVKMMLGDPTAFESIGSRLGFDSEFEDSEQMRLVWRGGRFPALLCLGIAGFLLFLSVPILQAIRIQGWDSPVGSLWYFPVMNLLLFGVAGFLLSLRRAISVDRRAARVFLSKRNLWKGSRLTVEFAEIEALKLAPDQVYSGFAVAGSTAGEKSFPAQSLRLRLRNGQSVLLDRGGGRKIEALAQKLSRLLDRPVERDSGDVGSTARAR